MDFEKIIEKIKDLVTFDEAEFQIFAQSIKPLSLKKNELWKREGSIGIYGGFVNKGILRQYYLKDGSEYTELFFSEGDFLGNYVSYLKKEPSKINIQALEDCELLLFKFETIDELSSRFTNVNQFNKIIAQQKLIELHDRLSSFLMDSPEERYYKLLDEKPDIHARVKQYLIAQYLGIKPESLSRIRKRHQ